MELPVRPGPVEWPILEWSPDGQTLAMIVGSKLQTLLPSRQLVLPNLNPEPTARTYWWGVKWRPDGRELLAVAYEGTVLVDVGQWRITRTFPEKAIVWWFGNQVAMSERFDPSQKPKSFRPSWSFGSVRRELPTGVFFVAASQDGRALLVQDDANSSKLDRERLLLLVLDPVTGRLRWSKVIRNAGRLDMRGELELDWNGSRELAARTADSSGGGTFLAYIDAKDWEVELVLTKDPRNTYWSGSPRWLDGRRLFVPLSLSLWYAVDQKTSRTLFAKFLALYDAETGRIRPVYESNKLFRAAASRRYVAIVEKVNDRQSLVISEWEKTSEGELITPKYKPSDAPEYGEYKRFLDNPEGPLVRVRS